MASGMEEANMFDVVHVGDQGLIGEIIEMRGDKASIQVYEETAGIGLGVPVVKYRAPLSVELGPGLIETMYDGIQKPLEAMYDCGPNITRGIKSSFPFENEEVEVRPCRKAGRRGRGRRHNRHGAGDHSGGAQNNGAFRRIRRGGIHRRRRVYGGRTDMQGQDGGRQRQRTYDDAEVACKTRKTLQRKAGSRNASHNGTESNRHSVPYS